MESPQSVAEVPVKPNRTPWIIAAVVIALCCCGLIVAVAAFYGFFAIRSVETQQFPTSEFPSVVTQEVMTLPPDSEPGEPPTGGLGNEILREDTWQAVAAAAVGQGCDQPIGSNSRIEVLQQPDTGGVWVEKWTVVCRSGGTYPFEVTYTLDATGATFDIKSLP